MTDNEIIKALESEVKSAEYVDNYYCNGVDLTLIKSAIDLINRLQAEIDELKHEREVLIEDIHHFVDKNNEQLEEIEMLQADNKTLENVIKNTFLKKAGLDIDPLAEVKAKAIKEFADRLLDKVKVVQVSNLTWIWLMSQDDINDIIKEMLGEE